MIDMGKLVDSGLKAKKGGDTNRESITESDILNFRMRNSIDSNRITNQLRIRTNELPNQAGRRSTGRINSPG